MADLPTGGPGAIRSTISGPTYLMTMSQLVTTNAGIIQQENADKALLTKLTAPNSSSLTPSFINWTSQGFPNIYILFSMTLNPPTVCSDGKRRTMYEYVSYLISKDLSTQIQTFQSNFLGMQMSYTITGTTVNIHVTKS
jgi:hypothetical protein